MEVVKGYLCIIGAAGLWGLIGPLAKLAFQEGVAPLEVAFWRALLAWLCFGGQALWQRQVRVRPEDLPWLGFFGLTGVFVFYGSYQLAVRQGGAALASVLLYTAPAWVALLAARFFREALTRAKLAALGLTLIGVALVSFGAGRGEAGPMSGAAVFWGLTAGFCYALYYLFGKRFAPRYAAATVFAYILPVGALCLSPWAVWSAKSTSAWAALAALALFSTYGAYHLYYAGLKRLEAGRAAITATLEPVVAGGVAYLWWGEFFQAIGYLGSGLILTAVVIMIRDSLRAARSAAAGPAPAPIDAGRKPRQRKRP
jgi:drug/metabolite transporter (DMT)-like permease